MLCCAVLYAVLCAVCCAVLYCEAVLRDVCVSGFTGHFLFLQKETHDLKEIVFLLLGQLAPVQEGHGDDLSGGQLTPEQRTARFLGQVKHDWVARTGRQYRV